MPSVEGVIEIGTTATKLVVAEIRDDGSYRVIDQAELPSNLGRDVFSTGLISRDNFMQCLGNLRRFKEQLEGWGLGPKETTVIATSALREAVNRDAVIDRILVKTGYAVTTIDGMEEIRLMYVALMDCLKDADPAFLEAPALVIEVGGGSTELLLTENKKIQAVHSLRLGTIMLEELVKSLGSLGDVVPFLNEYVDNSRPWLNSELCLNKIQQFFAIGQDARLAAREVGTPAASNTGGKARLYRISREDFDAFGGMVGTYSARSVRPISLSPLRRPGIYTSACWNTSVFCT
jgi:exopolyphosphatase/guanosine-5'-triphosphate,3'-diphosphate pyrophosphatase